MFDSHLICAVDLCWCMWICSQTSTHTCCLGEKIHPMWSSQLSGACVGACLPLAKARLWLPPLNVPTAAANGQSLSQPLSGPAVCFSFLCLISSFTLSVLPSVKEAVIGHPGAQHLISTHRFVYVCVCVRVCVLDRRARTQTLLCVLWEHRGHFNAVILGLMDRPEGGQWKSEGAQFGTRLVKPS